MNPSNRLVTVLALGVSLATARQLSSVDTDGFRVNLQRVEVSGLTTEYVELVFPATVESSQSVQVKEISFESVRANGLPIYIQPITRPFRLQAHKVTALEDMLRVRVYYNDVQDLDPLRSLLKKPAVIVEGRARANVGLPFAAKVLFFMNSARFATSFHHEVPVEFQLPGWSISAARAALDWTESQTSAPRLAWEAARNVVFPRLRAMQNDWLPRLFLVQAVCPIRDTFGNAGTIDIARAGLLLDNKTLLVPGEVIEPWSYDEEIVTAMKQRQVTVQTEALEIRAWRAGSTLPRTLSDLTGSSPWILSRKQLSIAHPGSPATSKLMILRSSRLPTKATVAARDAAGSFALLELSGGTPFEGIGPVTPLISKGASVVTDASLFRFPGSLLGDKATAEALQVSLQPSGPGFRLLRPIDSTGWGSPVVTANGALGVLTSETYVVFLETILEQLGYGR